MADKPNTQGRRTGNGGMMPPKERQFGQPNGNKQGRGFWKKEDTPRYKLEQMMKLGDAELESIMADKEAPRFERNLAKAILADDWKQMQDIINQVYGFPKQEIKQTNIEIPSPRLAQNRNEKK